MINPKKIPGIILYSAAAWMVFAGSVCDVAAEGTFYKSQTHTHSNAAGPHSTFTPSDLVSKYKNAGYGIISITDSNPFFPPWTTNPSVLSNPTPCSSYDVPGSFMCLLGEESTVDDHVCGYHTTQVGITSGSTGFTYFSPINPTYQKLLTHAVQQGGFSVIAHPTLSCYDANRLTSLQDYAAVEINGGLNGLGDNWVTDGQKLWDQVLTKNMGRKIFGVASDDTHGDWIGRGYIMVNMPEFTKAAYINAVKGGNFYAVKGDFAATRGITMNDAPFTLTCNGQSYHMGLTAVCANPRFTAEIMASRATAKINAIKIIRNGAVVMTKTDCPASQICSLDYSTTISENSYFRMEAFDSVGNILWSNPIWVNQPPCTANECSAAGIKRCSETGVQTCTLSGGCLRWGASVACASGQVCSNGACVANYAPKGFFDNAGCDYFSGWACDQNNFASPVGIHFYADGLAGTGKIVGATTANSNREAAVGVQCGGNTSHGFFFATPLSLKDNKSHTIYAYAINVPAGSNPVLTNSPKTLKCVPSCVPKTCIALGDYQCGSWSNGCGTTLDCGTCATGKTCSNGKCVSSCTARASTKCDSGDLYWYNSCNAKEGLAQDCGNDQPTSIYRCNGSWTQRETIKKVCSNNACASESAWVDDNDCAVSGKTCRNGVCQTVCTNECTNGTKQCNGGGVQTCALSGGCLKWSAAVACETGKTCSNGECKTACVPKTCSTLGSYECGSWSNGCGATLNCGTCAAGKTCSNGKCVSSCTIHASKKCNSGKLYWYNSCNVKEGLFQDCGTDILTDNYRCSGNWTQRQTIAKGCSGNACTSGSVWNNNTDCAAGNKLCSNGVCAATCTDECTINGAKQCMENGYQVCGNTDGDACLEWSEITACATGEICNAGTCSTPSCVPKTCSSLSYECGRVSDGCGKTLNCGVCGSENTCSNGICIDDSSLPRTLTRAEIVAKINEIVALIAKLQEQLKAMTGEKAAYSCTQITKVLRYGMKNDAEVKCLQEVLKAQGFAVVPTGDFGGITKTAVAQFQQKYANEILTPYGLRYGSGNVGNATRGKINSLIE